MEGTQILDGPPYVRLIEAVFVARLSEVLDYNGEYRYAFTEQAFDPFTGAYSEASPARSGTVGVNYATELRNRLVSVPRLVWMRLKGSVSQEQVYEFVDGPEGAASVHTEEEWTTDQDDYDAPDNFSIIEISSDDVVSLTGADVDDGRLVTWRNVGDFPILFTHDDSGSEATNRFATTTEQTFPLLPGETLTTWKDTTTDRNVVLTTSVDPTRPPITTTITTNQDDFVPTPGTPEIIFTLTSGDLNLTGIVPTNVNVPQIIRVTNGPSSTKTLTVKDNVTSTAENRIDLPADWLLPPSTSLDLRYDVPSSRWKPITPATQPPYWRDTLSGGHDNLQPPAGALPPSLIPTLSAAATLTGFHALLPIGVPFTITNPASNSDDLTLDHGSGSSTVPFDFTSGADVVLEPGESVQVVRVGGVVVEVGASLSLASGSGGSGATATWTKYTLTFADFTDNANSQQITLFTLPNGSYVRNVIQKHSVEFDGGGLVGYTINLGNATGETEILDGNELAIAPSGDVYSAANWNLTETFFTGGTVGANVIATANSVGETLDNVTQGSVDIWVEVVTLG